MNTRFLFGAVLCLVLGLLGGCQVFQLDRPAMRQGQSLLRPASASPRSIAVEIVWARFPAGDPQLNQSIWQEIDEASIDGSVRRELARNGFRAGVISGALPDALASAVNASQVPERESNDASSEKLSDLMLEPKIRRRLVQARRGRRVEIQASDIYPTLPLLVGDGRELGGSVFHDAQAIYALQVESQPDRTAIVELTPELHHGLPRLQFGQSDDGIFRQAPMRQREVFDRLRLRLKLAPGELLVLMSLPESGSRLGEYFHTVDSTEGRQQKLILIRLAEVPQSDTFASLSTGH